MYLDVREVTFCNPALIVTKRTFEVYKKPSEEGFLYKLSFIITDGADPLYLGWY